MSNEGIVRWEYTQIHASEYEELIDKGRWAHFEKDDREGTETLMPEHLIASGAKEAEWRVGRMNELGSEGWELVGEYDPRVAQNTFRTRAVLKRPYKLCPQCNERVVVGSSACDDCGTSLG
jgi:hypothetical protein